MNWIIKKICVYLIPRMLSRMCNERIPRTGEMGKKTNCFVIELYKNNEPYVLLEKYEKPQFHGLERDNDSYTKPITLSIEDVFSASLVINHYWGLYDIKYTGILSYCFQELSGYIYIRLALVEFIDNFAQFLFNRRTLENKHRHELLKFLIEKYMGKMDGFSYIDVTKDIHSIRIFVRPDHQEVMRKIEAHLDALVDTKELNKIRHQYFLTGVAFKSLDEYEDQDRKQRADFWMQFMMVMLTLFIAFFTMIQAGLIKLKPWIDLTS